MSAPVQLLQWGPDQEPDEVGEIKALLESDEYLDHNIHGQRITLPDKNLFLLELKNILSDAQLQILYLSCHGNQDGIGFKGNEPILVRFDELFNTMKNSGRNSKKPISIVLGFCHAMDNPVGIEKFAPDWVFELVGFKDSPKALQVSELGAGVIADMVDFGKSLGAIFKKEWPKIYSNDEYMPIFKKLTEKAYSQYDKKPERYLQTKSEDVIWAVNYGDGQWKRENLEQFKRS